MFCRSISPFNPPISIFAWVGGPESCSSTLICLLSLSWHFNYTWRKNDPIPPGNPHPKLDMSGALVRSSQSSLTPTFIHLIHDHRSSRLSAAPALKLRGQRLAILSSPGWMTTEIYRAKIVFMSAPREGVDVCIYQFIYFIFLPTVAGEGNQPVVKLASSQSGSHNQAI